MNDEFKKSSQGDLTRYVLENASSGGTSSGSVASVSMPMGGTRRRGDNLIAQEADSKTIPTSTPRNFVAKNAKTSGAGAHKDKKKAAKQGQEKHKKPFMEDHTTASGGWGQGSYDTYTAGRHGRGVAEDERDHPDHEIQMASSELMSIAKNAEELLDMVRRYSEQEGLDAWQQSKITKAADYLNSVLQSVNGEQQGVAEGSIKDVEAKIRTHDQRKADREQAGDPYVAHEIHSHNVIRKQLLDKRKRAQAAYHKKMDSEGVAEGAEIQIPTEDGITMQDIRLIAGEGPLTKKTVLQAIAVIRKQRRPQGVAEGVVDTIKKVGKALVKPVEVPGLNQMKDIHNTVHKREIAAQNKKYAPKDVDEGVAETLPMADAVKVLRQYGADHFKTTSNELHFYKNGQHMSVDLIFNNDATRSVNLSQLNSVARQLKGHSMEEGWDDIKKFGKKAAAASAIGLGIGAAHAGGFPSDVPAGGHNQLPDIVAHIKFKVGDKEITKDINLGSHYRSPGEAGEELKNFMKSKGIKFYEYSLERVKPNADDKTDNSPADIGQSTDDHMAKEGTDPYFESLQSMVERQLEPTMDLDTWIDNFQNADPQKYHQFKNKTPEKKK